MLRNTHSLTTRNALNSTHNRFAVRNVRCDYCVVPAEDANKRVCLPGRRTDYWDESMWMWMCAAALCVTDSEECRWRVTVTATAMRHYWMWFGCDLVAIQLYCCITLLSHLQSYSLTIALHIMSCRVRLNCLSTIRTMTELNDLHLKLVAVEKLNANKQITIQYNYIHINLSSLTLLHIEHLVMWMSHITFL